MAATTSRNGQSAGATRPQGRVLTLISVMILVGAEVFGVAIAGGWALAGLFELGDVFGYVLMGVFSLFGIYLMVQLWRRSVAVETGHGH